MSSGIRLSKLRSEPALIVDFPLLVGRMLQIGLARIVYDSAKDEEPLVKITEKGKQIFDIVQAVLITTQLIFR